MEKMMKGLDMGEEGSGKKQSVYAKRKAGGNPFGPHARNERADR
jgi:hypothetical protein